MNIKTASSSLPLALRLVLVVVGLVIFAAVGYLALIAPMNSQTKKIKREIATLEQQVNATSSARQQALSTSIIPTVDLFKLTTAMPDVPEIPELLQELDILARQSGIRFDRIAPKTLVNQSGFDVLPIEVVFQGSLFDLADFLLRTRNLVDVRDGKLSATGRLFAVDEINFGAGENGFPEISARFTIDAFIYNPLSLSTSTGGSTTTPTTTTPSSGTLGSSAQMQALGGAGR